MFVWPFLFCLLSAAMVQARVYEPCDLARELLYRFQTPRYQLARWVCIAYEESRYDTTAVNTDNADGSQDFGIFQINNRYWCFPPGTGCCLRCSSLLNDDISDDVQCSRTVFDETQRLGRDGFSAWTTYPRCNNGQADPYIANCAL